MAVNKVKIALVVKSQGNGFFDAAHEGAQDATAKIGLHLCPGSCSNPIGRVKDDAPRCD
jgi:ABC-type sugar transport system substrate-binding protein